MTRPDQTTNIDTGARDEHIGAYPWHVRWTPEEIKRQRIAKGLSQEELGAALGASRRAVTNWETGRAEPRGSNLRALEKLLGDAGPDERSPRLSEASPGELAMEIWRRLERAAATPTSGVLPPGLETEADLLRGRPLPDKNRSGEASG